VYMTMNVRVLSGQEYKEGDLAKQEIRVFFNVHHGLWYSFLPHSVTLQQLRLVSIPSLPTKHSTRPPCMSQ